MNSPIAMSWWLVIDRNRLAVYGLLDKDSLVKKRASFNDPSLILLHRLGSAKIKNQYGLSRPFDKPVLADPFTVVDNDGKLLYKVEDPEMIALITSKILIS